MKILLRLMVVVWITGLAACQTTTPYQAPPKPVDPAPPQTSAAASGAQQGQVQRQAQPQSSPVITLHLAQQKQEASLVAVNAGGSAPLYALPQPVLTQADIARVSPVSTAKGNFLLLEMNARGISKLDSITQQARGNYLLLSVRGQLVSVVQIGERVTDGRLLISTRNPQHTQAIIRLMQGKS